MNPFKEFRGRLAAVSAVSHYLVKYSGDHAPFTLKPIYHEKK
jgi:hypothetical protein